MCHLSKTLPLTLIFIGVTNTKIGNTKIGKLNFPLDTRLYSSEFDQTSI